MTHFLFVRLTETEPAAGSKRRSSRSSSQVALCGTGLGTKAEMLLKAGVEALPAATPGHRINSENLFFYPHGAKGGTWREKYKNKKYKNMKEGVKKQ